MAISTRLKVFFGAVGVTAAALAPFVHSFGPVLLDRYLGDSPAPSIESPHSAVAESAPTRIEVEELTLRNAEIQREILKLLIEAKKSQRLPAPEAGTSRGAVVETTASPPGALTTSNPETRSGAANSAPVSVAKAEPNGTPTPVQPGSSAKMAPTVEPKLLGVFPGQEFELCGFGQSTARIKRGSAGPVVAFRSMDRSIPDRPFRGYEKDIEVGKVVELYPHCQAAFDYENLSGTERIKISYVYHGDE